MMKESTITMWQPVTGTITMNQVILLVPFILQFAHFITAFILPVY